MSGYSAMKRGSAVPADWERIFTDGKIVGCELWDGRGRVLPTDFHGLARIFGWGLIGGCVKFFGY